MEETNCSVNKNKELRLHDTQTTVTIQYTGISKKNKILPASDYFLHNQLKFHNSIELLLKGLVIFNNKLPCWQQIAIEWGVQNGHMWCVARFVTMCTI